jgi:hypothetical protein
MINYKATAKEIKKLGFYRAYGSDGLSGRGMYWFSPARRNNRNTHMRIGCSLSRDKPRFLEHFLG